MTKHPSEMTDMEINESILKAERELIKLNDEKACRAADRNRINNFPKLEDIEMACLACGLMINAIRLYRDRNGTGLRDTKLFIEKWLEENPTCRVTLPICAGR